ncbi:DUF4920 domain-containing protein [Sungkyunkwania multivorans]|uniref:DUF4920 domain-containing protein n=1 Tax=Sungkyunkwania multivorans TaxID=1173618 RepID=A0ABW3D557_9FLAO
MKRFVIVFALATTVFACKDEGKSSKEVIKEPVTAVAEEVANTTFGIPVSEASAIDAVAMRSKFESLRVGDTIPVKFKAKVNSVCQKKGCWMRLDLGEDQETMVRFKDYGFFMPKDIADQEVVVEGKAFVEETSVKDLQHYAKDAGKTAEEIAAITKPKKTYSFTADGVLLTN